MKPLIPAIALAVLLSACSGQAPQEPPVSSAPPSSSASAPGGQEPEQAAEPPIPDWAAEQPVPEFLTQEQQDLFLRAFGAAGFLMGCSTSAVDDYPLSDGTMPDRSSYETVTLDNGWTYLVSVGRYQRWDDFQAMLDSIFTRSYQEELLNTETGDGERIPTFTSTPDGRMCFLDAGRGSNLEYDHAGMPDTYELVSQSDEAVEFYLIGHYAVLDYENTDETGAPLSDGSVTTEKYPIRMEHTADGWRVSEIHVPF